MECKYKLPCGMCDLTNLFCNIVPTSKNSCDIASSVEYRDAIEFLKRERTIIKDEEAKQYYDLAIKALQRERDMYFPGCFHKEKLNEL